MCRQPLLVRARLVNPLEIGKETKGNQLFHNLVLQTLLDLESKKADSLVPDGSADQSPSFHGWKWAVLLQWHAPFLFNGKGELRYTDVPFSLTI